MSHGANPSPHPGPPPQGGGSGKSLQFAGGSPSLPLVGEGRGGGFRGRIGAFATLLRTAARRWCVWAGACILEGPIRIGSLPSDAPCSDQGRWGEGRCRGRHDPRRVPDLRTPADRLDRRLPRRPGGTARDGPDRARASRRPACPPRPPRSPRASRRSSTTSSGSSCRGSRTGSTRASSATSRPTPRCPACWATSSARGLGVLGLSWQSSPALTELEEVVTDWVRQMVGLSEAWSGVIQDTASTSTLVALICARERATGYGLRPGRPAGRGEAAGRLRVRSGAQLGREGRPPGRVRPRERAVGSPTTRRMRIDPEALERRRPRGPRRGQAPCAVVATAGHHRLDGHRPGRGDRRGGPRARALAPRRRGHGGLGDDPARVPMALGGRRGGRLAGDQRPQVARGGLRLLALLRARRRAPRPRDVHQPELSAILGGRAGSKNLPRLGHPARAAASGP